MATLLELRQTVSSTLLRDPNNKVWPVSFIDKSINNWYTRIQQDCLDMYEDWDQNFTQQSTPGTQEYTLPSDFLRLQLARFNGVQLHRTTKKEIKEKYTTMTQWQPWYYYLSKWKLGLFPVPDSSGEIDVDYTASLPTITDSVDSLNPVYLDMAIAYYAAAECFDQVGKYDQSKVYRDRYDSEINKAMLYMVQDQNLYYY